MCYYDINALSIIAATVEEAGIVDQMANHASWIVFVIAVIFATIKWFFTCFMDCRSKTQKKEQHRIIFADISSGLSSSNPASQISAAILLRRYLSKESSPDYQKEAINLVASMLRTAHTGVFQKTLSDSLAYAQDLVYADLQKGNFQDSYIGTIKGIVNLDCADFYMSDLSYALIDNVRAINAYFINSILLKANIKNSNFSKASFRNADLTNAVFKNVILHGADFNGASNIPVEIREHLVDGIYTSAMPLTTTKKHIKGSIFFSMPGSVSKEEQIIIRDFKKLLENMEYDVCYYHKDDYPQFGQLNKVRHSIKQAIAMIAFGTKQYHIIEAKYHPGLPNEKTLKEEWWSTPWNEIEVGMGLMSGIPILLVKDNLINNGIFDSHLSECFVATISTEYDIRKIANNKDFQSWLSCFNTPHNPSEQQVRVEQKTS